MSVDFESVKDKAVVLAQSGVTKAKELTGTGISKAKELANAGAAKARELSEIGKLKVQNSTEQEAIRKAYSELGKLYYAECGSSPEAPFAELCQSITDSLARISYNNERIADIKAAGRSKDETDETGESAEEELVSEAPVDEEPCCCGEESAAEESCCCGGEPAAEESVSEEPVPETPCCCCGAEEPAAEDDKPEA